MLSLGGYYILNKSLCVPVRDKVRTRISFSIRYTRSQSGWMWHSLCPIQSPDKGWSLCLAPKGSPFASFVMMSFSKVIFIPRRLASL